MAFPGAYSKFSFACVRMGCWEWMLIVMQRRLILVFKSTFTTHFRQATRRLDRLCGVVRGLERAEVEVQGGEV